MRKIGYNFLRLLAMVLLLAPLSSQAASEIAQTTRDKNARLARPAFCSARVAGGFWGAKRELLLEVTMPAQWLMLERNHHLDNFRVTAGQKEGAHLGPVFLDSDLYKWLEAASYLCGKYPGHAELRGQVDEVVGLIEAAQMDDGYINTYYQNFAPDRRFTNLWLNHELYCAGHLMEAACSHKESLGDDRLLDAARRFGDHIARVFGPGKNEGVPGHQEIELALARLYRMTGEKSYLNTAAFFVNQRGRQKGFAVDLVRDLNQQANLSRLADRKRKPYLTDKSYDTAAYGELPPINPLLLPRLLQNFLDARYFQAQAPILQQTVAEGHSVRAMYYFAGAADVYLLSGDDRLICALTTIWDNTIQKRTYITGGMGALPVIEGFGKDYELPNKSYTETCAAIGSIFFSQRLLEATGDARYAGQIERALYNAVLPALSLDGRHYFYQNPLKAEGDRERQTWYPVACCPPNIARLFSSLEKYIYSTGDNEVWVHQFISSEADLVVDGKPVRIEMESGLPWSGDLTIRLVPAVPTLFTMMIRQPEWAYHSRVRVNGEPIEYEPEPGRYLDLTREWKRGDKIEMDFLFSPVYIEANPKVAENRGKAAIQNGPLIYCVESKDNPDLDVHSMVADKSIQLTAEHKPGFMDGAATITGGADDGKPFVAIPYYLWANRGKSHMEIWINAK